MEPIEGMEVPPGSCLKLNKAVYGLKQAGACWNKHFTKKLKDYGFRQSEFDHCLFTMRQEGKWLMIFIFVDDMVVATNCADMKTEFFKEMNKHFTVEDRGDLDWFLAIKINRSIAGGYVDLSQERFATNFATELGWKPGVGRRVMSPEMKEVLNKSQGASMDKSLTDEERKYCEEFEYRTHLGRGMYHMCCVNPAIARKLKILGQFVSDPGLPHIKSMQRLGAYCGETASEPLRLHGPKTMEEAILSIATDSDDANNEDTYRSCYSVLSFMGDLQLNPHCVAIVDWTSAWSVWVTSSSYGSEICGIARGYKKALEYRSLLEEIGLAQTAPTKIINDCQSAITVMNHEHPGRAKGSKHVERRIFAAQQGIKAGLIQLIHVKSEDNPADILATYKDITNFTKLRTIVMGHEFSEERVTDLKDEDPIKQPKPAEEHKKDNKFGAEYSSDYEGDGKDGEIKQEPPSPEPPAYSQEQPEVDYEFDDTDGEWLRARVGLRNMNGQQRIVARADTPLLANYGLPSSLTVLDTLRRSTRRGLDFGPSNFASDNDIEDMLSDVQMNSNFLPGLNLPSPAMNSHPLVAYGARESRWSGESADGEGGEEEKAEIGPDPKPKSKPKTTSLMSNTGRAPRSHHPPESDDDSSTDEGDDERSPSPPIMDLTKSLVYEGPSHPTKMIMAFDKDGEVVWLTPLGRTDPTTRAPLSPVYQVDKPTGELAKLNRFMLSYADYTQSCMNLYQHEAIKDQEHNRAIAQSTFPNTPPEYVKDQLRATGDVTTNPPTQLKDHFEPRTSSGPTTSSSSSTPKPQLSTNSSSWKSNVDRTSQGGTSQMNRHSSVKKPNGWSLVNQHFRNEGSSAQKLSPPSSRKDNHAKKKGVKTNRKTKRKKGQNGGSSGSDSRQSPLRKKRPHHHSPGNFHMATSMQLPRHGHSVHTPVRRGTPSPPRYEDTIGPSRGIVSWLVYIDGVNPGLVHEFGCEDLHTGRDRMPMETSINRLRAEEQQRFFCHKCRFSHGGGLDMFHNPRF